MHLRCYKMTIFKLMPLTADWLVSIRGCGVNLQFLPLFFLLLKINRYRYNWRISSADWFMGTSRKAIAPALHRRWYFPTSFGFQENTVSRIRDETQTMDGVALLASLPTNKRCGCKYHYIYHSRGNIAARFTDF